MIPPLLFIALAGLAYALVSARLATSFISTPLFFVGLGLLAGPPRARAPSSRRSSSSWRSRSTCSEHARRVLAISVKAWVFTLGAIEVIGDARLGQPGSAVAFLLFVLLAQSVHLAAVGMSYAMPDRSTSVLDRFADAFTRFGRQILIALGLVFGTWFLLQALSGFGVLAAS